MTSSITKPIVPGCCDFQLPRAKDNSIICGRSMEFPIKTGSKICVHRVFEKNSTTKPDGSQGEWTTRIGYIGIEVLGQQNKTIEGLNQWGLSVGLLSLDCTTYQTISKYDRGVLGITDLCGWILGNCENCEKVKDQLRFVKIWGDEVDPITKKSMGLHVAVHDAKGQNLVIEFIDGEVRIYDNPVGVLTNDPQFPWHQENLRLYNLLTPNNPADSQINGQTIPSFIEGGGMLGLPGGWNSVERHIRVATVVRFAVRADTALQAVNLAVHTLNTVDRPKGTTLVSIGGSPVTSETTRWTTIKDLTNCVFYYQSYDDLTLRSINLAKIDWWSKIPFTEIPIATGQQTVINMNAEIKLKD